MNKISKLNLVLTALLVAAVSICSCRQVEKPSLAQQFDPKAVVVEKIPAVEIVPVINVVSLQIEYSNNSISKKPQSFTTTSAPENTLRITQEIGSKYSLTYGGRGWGSLGSAQTAAEMIRIAENQARQTSSILSQELGTIINPNICQGSGVTLNDSLARELVNQAQQKNYKVMFDINTGTQNPEQVCRQMINRFLPLGSNVCFDLDIEHINVGGFNGQIDSSTLNRIIEYYFNKREQLGYQEPGMFAFYLFTQKAVLDPSALRLNYENGIVVPIADGYGLLPEKQAFADWLEKVYGQKGIMEFVLRWGREYDRDGRWEEFFQNNHNAIIFAHQ